MHTEATGDGKERENILPSALTETGTSEDLLFCLPLWLGHGFTINQHE